MTRPLTIHYEKAPDFFGKPQLLCYEAAEFSGGQIAFVDEHGTVLASQSRHTLLDELNRHGRARVATPTRRKKNIP